MLEYLILAVILICALIFIGRNILRQIKGAGLGCQGCSCDCERCDNPLTKSSDRKDQTGV